jgi:hypothetical protein
VPVLTRARRPPSPSAFAGAQALTIKVSARFLYGFHTTSCWLRARTRECLSRAQATLVFVSRHPAVLQALLGCVRRRNGQRAAAVGLQRQQSYGKTAATHLPGQRDEEEATDESWKQRALAGGALSLPDDTGMRGRQYTQISAARNCAGSSW